MSPSFLDSELEAMLGRLKASEVLSIQSLNGDEITLAERLVELRLAYKTCTRNNTYYTYGVKE
jgi:hypothetical protein